MSDVVSSGLLVLAWRPMTRVNTCWSGQDQHRVNTISGMKMRDEHGENRVKEHCLDVFLTLFGVGCTLLVILFMEGITVTVQTTLDIKIFKQLVSSYIEGEKYFNNLSKTILFIQRV